VNVLVSDSARICQINEDSLGYRYDLEKTKQRLEQIIGRPTDKIYVACIDGNIVGYIHGCDYECTYADSLKNIMAIAVDKGYQGKGIGRALLNAIEGWAKECGCSGVRLVSGFNREGAHQFYLHCGYTVRKQQKNFIKYFD
jgi:GNAT superfamily N-acetyltransferase